MGGFAAFATGFVGGLNRQHEENRAKEDEWLAKASDRFDEAYKESIKRKEARVKEEEDIDAALPFFDGDRKVAKYVVRNKIKPEDYARVKADRLYPQTQTPVNQQTQQSGMVPPQPQSQPQQPGMPQQPSGPRKELAPVPEVFLHTIQTHADRTGLDPALIGSVFMMESGARPEVISGQVKSSAGAVGPMQTKPTTLTDPGYGVTPAQNDSVEEKWRVGTDYLAAMKQRYGGNVPAALAAYNWGPGNVDAWLARGADPAKLPPETRNYVSTIMQRMPKAAPPRQDRQDPLNGAGGRYVPVEQQDPRERELSAQVGKRLEADRPVTEMNFGDDVRSVSPTRQGAQEAPSSPAQGGSGWPSIGELLTGRRDQKEVYDRGITRAGAQYGMSPEEARGVMSASDLDRGPEDSDDLRMSMGGKPIDQDAIAENILKDPGNFASPEHHRQAFNLAVNGRIADALTLADPLAVKRAEAQFKGLGDSTSAFQTKLLIAKHLQNTYKQQTGKDMSDVDAWKQVNDMIKTSVNPETGQISITDEVNRTATSVETVGQDGKPITGITPKQRDLAQFTIDSVNDATTDISYLLKTVGKPGMVGPLGVLNATVGSTAAGIPLIGDLVASLTNQEDLAKVRQKTVTLARNLMATMTKDGDNRYSNQDFTTTQDILGKITDVTSNATAVSAALNDLLTIQSKGRVRSIYALMPESDYTDAERTEVLAEQFMSMFPNEEDVEIYLKTAEDHMRRYAPVRMPRRK